MLSFHPYLHKRGNVFYCQFPMPKIYQFEVGKKEIWKSLGVTSYNEARLKVNVVTAHIIEGIMMDKVRKLKHADIPAIAERMKKTLLNLDDYTRMTTFRLQKAVEQAGEDFSIHDDKSFADKDIYARYKQALTEGSHEAVREIVGSRLLSSGIHFDPNSRVFQQLCYESLKAVVLAYEEIIARNKGEWNSLVIKEKEEALIDVLEPKENTLDLSDSKEVEVKRTFGQ